MNKFAKILTAISNIMRSGLLLILVLALIWGIIYIQRCNKERSYEQYNANKAKLIGNYTAQKVEKKTYRPPVVKTPITPDKPPVEKKKLPVHPKVVKRTIEVKTETPEKKETKITLVEDKKGNIYVIDNKDKAKITVTEWKPKIADFDFKFGYSLVYSKGIYHCLSLDYFRIWRFYIGSEVGVGIQGKSISDYLVGLSLKFKWWELFSSKVSFRFSLVGGYDFIGSSPYIGLNLKF